jgi:poly(hydroxyalkanoate) depolymerase family esterase
VGEQSSLVTESWPGRHCGNVPTTPLSNAGDRASDFRDWEHRVRVGRRACLAPLAWSAVAPAALALGLLATTPARAASPAGPITGWASGVPSYISMFEYVPAKVAATPPILVVSHYCGGTAAGVFGEAQGGGIVSAADMYGFLMIFPQTSNNCWDVGSTKSLTHDGGGDTQAIAEMVKYEIAKRGADPSRVYATGTSSGAMMTEALLAVYPDVFKAGAEFSGVPAGCWSASYSPSNQWSGPCAGGMVSHTAQQWGDMVRAMDPGYSGYRPRIQLWHGMADATINYNNQTEAIKEWTDVLGLGANPTSTDSLTFNSHSWTRESWKNPCGLTVLEAWSEQNGPHGTDANLNATYVIPFLALDKTGPDPQTAACGDGGASGSSSGASSSGSSTGSSSGSSGGVSSGSGGGSGSSGGSSSGGGSGGTGSGADGGGGSGIPGASSSGTGGGSGGSGSSGPSSGEGGLAGSEDQPASARPGCSCVVVGGSRRGGALAWGAVVACGAAWSRRRRRG